MLITNCHSFAMTNYLFKFLKKCIKKKTRKYDEAPLMATARLCPMERTASGHMTWDHMFLDGFKIQFSYKE